MIRRLPTQWRARAALSLVRKLVKATIRQSKVKARLSRGTGVVEIRSAAFEQLRDPAPIPMLGFYAAALKRLLTHCSVDAEVGVTGQHDSGWNLTVVVRSPRRVEAIDAA